MTIDHQINQWNVLFHFIFFIHRIKDEFLYLSIKHGYAILLILHLLGVNKKGNISSTRSNFVFRQTEKLRYEQMEIFHQLKASNIQDQISLNLLNSFHFYNFCNNLFSLLFENEVINYNIYPLYYAEFYNKCTGLHILFSSS